MAKHTTYVWQHPDVPYDMITSGESYFDARRELLAKVSERDLPAGWELKHSHNDEHSNPSMDQGVTYTDWEWKERCGL